MQAINQIYHEENPEDMEYIKQKQEVTKKLLYSILIQPEIIECWKIRYGIEIKPEVVEIIQIDLEESPDPEDEGGFDEEFELGMYQKFEDDFDLEDGDNSEDCEFEEGFFDNVVVFRKHILFIAKLNENSPYQIEYASEIVDEHISLVIEPTEYSIDFSRRVCEEKEEL